MQPVTKISLASLHIPLHTSSLADILARRTLRRFPSSFPGPAESLSLARHGHSDSDKNVYVVCVYYCSVYYKAVRVGGGPPPTRTPPREGDGEGHVLRETVEARVD
jgi:hypothetical protein